MSAFTRRLFPTSTPGAGHSAQLCGTLGRRVESDADARSGAGEK